MEKKQNTEVLVVVNYLTAWLQYPFLAQFCTEQA